MNPWIVPQKKRGGYLSEKRMNFYVSLMVGRDKLPWKAKIRGFMVLLQPEQSA